MTFHPDPPAVKLDELSAQRQTKPRPFRFLVGVADLTELLEDGLLVLQCDSDSAIHDGDLHHPADARRAHVDPPTLWRELHGVREQVQQDLLDLALVCTNLAHPVVEGALKRDPPAAR